MAASLAAEGFEAVVVDLPGHGESGHVRADLRSGADLLATFGPGTYIGYSMGGRYALHTAFLYPMTVTAMALIGATPGIEDELARAERRTADEALAMRIGTIGVRQFMAEWTSQPLFGGHLLRTDDLASRLTNSADGLSSSLRLAGTGSQLSLWQRLHELTMPVLAIAGSRDQKFSAIAEQMAAHVVDGRAVTVTGAAHAAHLERPEPVRAALIGWLRSLPR